MKPGVIMTMLVSGLMFIGCQSGLYKSEIKSGSDGKTAAMKYRVVETIPSDPAQIDETMPITVAKQREEHSDNSTGLCVLTLGIIPAFYDSWVDYSITVDSPIGKQSGTARLSAKSWIGWICLIPYPGFGDERPDDPKLPNKDREDKLCDALVEQLVSKYNAKEYDAFVATSKEKALKAQKLAAEKELAEQKRVAARRDELQKMIDSGEIDAVLSACEAEMTQTGKDSPWKEMVSLAESKYVELVNGKVRTSIDAKRYSEAEKICAESRGRIGDDRWWADSQKEIASALCKHAREIEDGDELVECFYTIEDQRAREAIVVRLGELSQLNKLKNSALLMELVRTTSDDDVILSAINGGLPKSLLHELISPSRSEVIVNLAMKRLESSSAAWSIVAKSKKSGQLYGIPYNLVLLNAYVNGYNSEQDILHIVKDCEAEMTDGLRNYILKVRNTQGIIEALKVADQKATDAMVKRYVGQILGDKSEYAGAFVEEWGDIRWIVMKRARRVLEGINDQSVRAIVAEEVLVQTAMRGKNIGGLCEANAEYFLDKTSENFIPRIFSGMKSGEYIYSIDAFRLIWNRIPKEEQERFLTQVRERNKSAKGIVFAGFYLGMPKADFCALSCSLGVAPSRNSKGDKFMFSRAARYKLFPYEDNEFMGAFLENYMPPNSNDLLSKWSWSHEHSFEMREPCYLYRSMKHDIQVRFYYQSGRLEVLSASYTLE